MESTLEHLVALAAGLLLGATPLGHRAHGFLRTAVERATRYARRNPLLRTSGGWAAACVGIAGAVGTVGTFLLWALFLASIGSRAHAAPAVAAALLIAVAAGSRQLWQVRGLTSATAHSLLAHWLTLFFFYGALGPAGALAAEVFLIATGATEPGVARTATQMLVAIVTYIPRRLADLVVLGFSTPDPGAAPRPRWRGGAEAAWGVAVAAGLATFFHVSGWGGQAYFANWEHLAYPHRVAELSRCWDSGTIYPRVYPTFAWGYGYPYPNFYPPAVTFLGASLHHAGLSVANALAGTAWIILFLGSLGIFLLANVFAGPVFATLAAVLASAARAGVPMTVYGTGTLSHALGQAWVPFVLLGARRCYVRPGATSAALFGLAVAGMVLIHNISTAIAAGLVLLYLGVRGLRHPGARWALLGGILGVGLAAFFWVPALAEMDCILIERAYQTRWTPWRGLVRLDPWWTALAHFNLHALQHQTPFIGRSLSALHRLTSSLVWGLAFILLVGGYKGEDGRRRWLRDETFLWLALFAVTYFAMAESAWAWRVGSPLRLVQFPGRVARMAVIIGPVLAAVATCDLWWRLHAGRTPEVRLACAWFAVYAFAGALSTWRAGGPVTLGVLIWWGAPLAVGVIALMLRRAPWHQAAAGALVACVALLALTTARDRREFMRLVHRPLPAPDCDLTAEAYLQWERARRFVGTNIGEYLPRWTHGRMPTECPPQALVGAGCTVLASRNEAHGHTFVVRVERATKCVYGALFYPGWMVLCDGRRVECSPSRQGLVSFTLPAEAKAVVMRFAETPTRAAADIVSLCSALLMAAVIGTASVLRLRGGPRRTRKGAPAGNSAKAGNVRRIDTDQGV